MTLDPKNLNSNKFSFTNDDLTPDNDSIYTLEDDLSETHLGPVSQQVGEEVPQSPSRLQQTAGEYGIYNLPTHISSHRDVLEDDYSRTQPSTPVGTPYQERPNHPLRALTSTQLVLNQQNGTDDSLVSLEPEANISGYTKSSLRKAEEVVEEVGHNDEDVVEEEEEEDWDKKGAAQAIKRETNELTGETDEILIRRSVKDFKFGKTLGVGSYSTVLLATDKNTGKNFAVKVLDKRHIIREKKVKYVNIEKNTLNRLGKRNGLIHLFFTFQDEASLYFVLDYASNGELLNLIKNYGTLNEETTRYYGAQILDAIKYMHNNGVIHRDLKPENILLDESNRVQITDFGTAKLLEKNANGKYPLDCKAKSFVGTAEYVSPELLNEKSIGKPCDIWAFGCILYQMIAGKPPFKAPNDYLTFQKIVKLQYAFTAGFPMGLRDLIKKILVVNPKDRILIKEIQKHYFFQSIDFNNPEESIWKPNPPEEIGPYKINAKSMLPIPELNNNTNNNANSSRLKINLPPKRATTSSSNSIPTTANTSTSSLEDVVVTDSNDSNSSPSQPTQSQQVLMRAKAAVAARKQQQQQEGKRNASGGGANAANAASIALSRQPNDIIKAHNDKQEKDKRIKQEVERIRSQGGGVPTTSVSAPPTSSSSDDLRTPPLSASSNFNASPSSNGRPKSSSSQLKTLRERKKPNIINPNNTGSTASSSSPSPMTKLDLEFSNYLKNIEERILKKGNVTSYNTSVDLIEKKYRGRLVDSPLGGNKSNTSSLLTQVANGSLSGLRSNTNGGDINGDFHGVINHGTEGDENIENKVSSTKNKFRNFFKNTIVEDEKKSKVLVLTNNARLLIFMDSNNSLELKTEIDLTNPYIKVKELLPPVIKNSNTGGLFLIESYPNAYIFETSQLNVSQWCDSIYKSKAYRNERLAQKLIESDPSGDAGTILGSDAARRAANLATTNISSPPLSPQSGPSNELKSPVSFNSEKFEDQKQRQQQQPPSPQQESKLKNKSSLPSMKKPEGMFKDLIRNKTSTTRSNKGKELPNNGLLNYGLPIKREEKSINNGSNSNNRNPLIAAAEAAISNQKNDDGTSSSGGGTSGNDGPGPGSGGTTSLRSSRGYNQVPNNVPRLITGMNSRLLARSNDRKKK